MTMVLEEIVKVLKRLSDYAHHAFQEEEADKAPKPDDCLSQDDTPPDAESDVSSSESAKV